VRSSDVAVSGTGPISADADAAVTALYRQHALWLIRLAYIMLGSRAAAEDVVQDAFCGLHRRWEHLARKESAVGYLRSSVLNGCRSAHSDRARVVDGAEIYQPPAISAEAAVLSSERRREVVRALRQLPDRQREVLVLRYYLDVPDEQIARDLGIARTTVRSTRHRALAALERHLGGQS
jgi:RNA polymerase sigma-70 factor (sigma-E family)